ncbi:MAG: AI-2E family transporter, partial [Halobacteriovoraceae bacterium]|nr:AI-2E family transporter [Halobacteriovoraceae bacterium]
EQMILEKFSQMNDVTLVCNGIGGVIQGLLAGAGMWLAGFESIFLWSVIMVILAFIPLLGISIITIPASIYLYFKGEPLAALLFFLYTGVIALLVENLFKPKFMGQKIKVNSLLILFYIIAGMGTFGMAGIFYGPIICIIFLTMVEIFQVYYLPRIDALHDT